MTDRFGGYRIDFDSPFTHAETADFSSNNYTFGEVPRALACDDDGLLTVDMLGAGSNITVPVVKGVNAYRVTRIYNAGSAAMNVTGLS